MSVFKMKYKNRDDWNICNMPNNASIIFLMTLCMYTYFVVPHLSYFAILSYLEEENGHIHTYSMF